MLKAVLFDFDGVIVDSDLLHYKAINTTIGKYEVEISKEKYWDRYLGYNDVDCFKAISKDFKLGLDDEIVEKLIGEKFSLFKELVKKESTIIDGVAEFIDMLKGNQIPIAICSGALLAEIELMLNGSSFADCFEVIVSADTQGLKRGKPHPDGYLLTLQRLNESKDDHILPGECLVVEDSHWGLEAAAAAKMGRIAVINTYPKEELEKFAQIIVARLDELTMDDLHSLYEDC